MLNKKENTKIDVELLLKNYERQSRRLDKIMKQSDRQQFEMIKLNEELDEHKNHLEQKVDEKTKELRDLNKNLEQRVKDEVEANRIKDKQLNDQAKFAQLGELIGNIAHQWRQPLNAISSAATGMQLMRNMGMADEEEENQSIKDIADTAQVLSSIINNFRDFVNQKNEKHNVILQDLLKTNIDIFESSYEEDIKITIDFPEEELEFVLVSSSFSQVVLNLLKNARDALLNSTKDDEKEIVIELKNNEKEIVMSVKDNGIGIKEDILPKIYDPYFTTKHQSQGVGLGLYIVRESVEKHLNGNIDIEMINNWTIFKVSLLK